MNRAEKIFNIYTYKHFKLTLELAGNLLISLSIEQFEYFLNKFFIIYICEIQKLFDILSFCFY